MAVLDIILSNIVIARGIAERERVAVFAGDNAVVAEIILRLDAEGEEIRFDIAIWIENMDEQFRGTVRAHTGEVGRNVASFAFETMTSGAILRENLVALLRIAALGNGGNEILNEGVFFFQFRSANVIDDLAGFFGNRG